MCNLSTSLVCLAVAWDVGRGTCPSFTHNLKVESVKSEGMFIHASRSPKFAYR